MCRVVVEWQMANREHVRGAEDDATRYIVILDIKGMPEGSPLAKTMHPSEPD